MALGGKRPGAGRPKGSASQKTREIANKAAEAGETPLEYMLSVMRDPEATRADRMDMAKAAAPYIHPRLSSVEAKMDVETRSTVRKIVREIVDPSDQDA